MSRYFSVSDGPRGMLRPPRPQGARFRPSQCIVGRRQRSSSIIVVIVTARIGTVLSGLWAELEPFSWSAWTAENRWDTETWWARRRTWRTRWALLSGKHSPSAGCSASRQLPNSVKNSGLFVQLRSRLLPVIRIQQTQDLLWQQFVVMKTNFYSLLKTTVNFVTPRSLVPTDRRCKVHLCKGSSVKSRNTTFIQVISAPKWRATPNTVHKVFT